MTVVSVTAAGGLPGLLPIAQVEGRDPRPARRDARVRPAPRRGASHRAGSRGSTSAVMRRIASSFMPITGSWAPTEASRVESPTTANISPGQPPDTDVVTARSEGPSEPLLCEACSLDGGSDRLGLRAGSVDEPPLLEQVGRHPRKARPLPPPELVRGRVEVYRGEHGVLDPQGRQSREDVDRDTAPGDAPDEVHLTQATALRWSVAQAPERRRCHRSIDTNRHRPSASVRSIVTPWPSLNVSGRLPASSSLISTSTIP